MLRRIEAVCYLPATVLLMFDQILLVKLAAISYKSNEFMKIETRTLVFKQFVSLSIC
jgi:hypothetical protein